MNGYRYEVVWITRDEAAPFIHANHYAMGLSAAALCVGLRRRMQDQALVGVAAFLPPVSQAARRKPLGPDGEHLVWDLHRLALLDHEDEPNLTSWFLAQALTELWGRTGARVVTTFADSTEGHTGTIYRALNALPLGKTPRRVTYQGPDGRLHSTRQNGRNIPRAEAEANGWEAVWSEPKHRFALIIGKGHPSRRKLRQTVAAAYGVRP